MCIHVLCKIQPFNFLWLLCTMESKYYPAILYMWVFTDEIALYQLSWHVDEFEQYAYKAPC